MIAGPSFRRRSPHRYSRELRAGANLADFFLFSVVNALVLGSFVQDWSVGSGGLFQMP